jgi:hypothetical protein
MKNILATYTIRLANFLSKTASRLDGRYRYLHIDLPPNETKFNIKFDQKETLDAMYNLMLSGVFDYMFQSVGASADISKTEKQKISNGEVYIAWINYKENYIEVPEHNDFTDEDTPDSFDDDDDELGVGQIRFMNSGMFNFHNENIHYTPWGRYLANNPMSPINMYEQLWVAHFKGFTTKTIPNFDQIIAATEGVANFVKIDPYSIVIAVAKCYDFTDVQQNVERSLYEALGIEISNESKSMEDHLMGVREQSLSLFNSGVENIALVFPEPNFSVEIVESPTEQNILDLKKLFGQIQNLIVFRNGELYEL